MLVWLGSAISLIAATVLGLGQLDGVGRILIVIAAIAYIIGTQLPTITINIPLNNRLQTLNIDALSDTAQVKERQRFEARWNRWNMIRTAFASLTSVLLISLLVII